MQCYLDQATRPVEASDDWADDPRWGVVHRAGGGWHTVTGTALIENDGVLQAQSAPVPGLPDAPSLPGEVAD